ncbi:MAG: flagellar motor protein MotB [Desulforegulaceae bacterium]|jgi:chemotaxis protein MotB|nr:flagellar motor protein MotB [Desulforegulaceae bacterium]
MRKRNSNANEFLDDDETGWIVTFSDLMTLLLVFFILLFSISSLNQKKFESVLESIRISLNSKQRPLALMEVLEIPEKTDKTIRIDELTGLTSRKDRIEKDIKSYISKHKIQDNVSVSILDDKIVVQIRGTALFDSGDAVLKLSAEPVLKQLVTVFEAYDEYNINIKGHTDNVPISTLKYPSNWELSAIRATNVLRFFISQGINPLRLTATGYGSLMPLRPNTSPENRAANRRVEFVLEKRGR